MKPETIQSRIYLDGGDPVETKEIQELLGFLDGQTTNPTLISKNPHAEDRLARGEKFTPEEIYDFYKKVVTEISHVLPKGSISIEVYADAKTTSEEMFRQAKEMFGWIPNAHIKFPITKEGLAAAALAVQEKMRINMTLCFSQEQAAAVYAATRGAQKGQVFVSPFVGRLDDGGENGMDLIANVVRMYQKGDGHVEVLTASVRSTSHVLCALNLGSDIITAPFAVLREWGVKGIPLPDRDFLCDSAGLRPIPYEDIDLNRDWFEYDIRHELTEAGIGRFSEDWNKLIS